MAADRAKSEKCIVKVVDWLNLKKFERLKRSLEESCWLEASGRGSCDVVVVDGEKVNYRGECRGIL